jgi:methylmalonyl-CoA/ethylmalonyl-CoA epimerase
MVPRLDHIGYAVNNIKEFLEEFFVPLFQPIEISSTVEDPVQRVRVAFVTLAGGVRIELIEPVDDASPISKIIANRNGGIYHLCYSVDSLEGAISVFREKGCMVVSGPAPATAFQGRRIAFMYTPQRDLIEFVEATQ